MTPAITSRRQPRGGLVQPDGLLGLGRSRRRRTRPWHGPHCRIEGEMVRQQRASAKLAGNGDVILTRDPSMHHSDIAVARGAQLALRADHDGVIVNDVVTEWAARHGQSFDLELAGVAGGNWSSGRGGERIELDAVEVCRILSGRGEGPGLLSVRVPF